MHTWDCDFPQKLKLRQFVESAQTTDRRDEATVQGCQVASQSVSNIEKNKNNTIPKEDKLPQGLIMIGSNMAGIGRGRGKGRGRGRGKEVKTTFNEAILLKRSSSMPVRMDQLTLSDFNNNFNMIEDVTHDEESARRFVKSQLFRKGIQSIKSDYKRQQDEIRKSMPNIYDIDEEGDEMMEQFKPSEREWDKGKKFNGSNYGGDSDIENAFKTLKIFESSGGKLYVEQKKKVEGKDSTIEKLPSNCQKWKSELLEEGCIKDEKENEKKMKTKVREWDRGKVWDEFNGMWITKGRNNASIGESYYLHDER
ncbi:uncharacterized protein [Clytia hemisphaerica]